ncbi:MAG: hypothetical protein V4495_29385 [Pseudomonadota bacterium]
MKIQSIAFDPERHESGSLRALYRAVYEYEGEQIWLDVFLANWDVLNLPDNISEKSATGFAIRIPGQNCWEVKA